MHLNYIRKKNLNLYVLNLNALQKDQGLVKFYAFLWIILVLILNYK